MTMDTDNPPEWRKSSHCADSQCVEVAMVDANKILIRDNKDPNGLPLTLTRADWVSFVEAVKAGKFDLS